VFPHIVICMETRQVAESAGPVIGPREIGRTGVIVSPIGLDGATFGWAAGIDDTSRVLDTYAASGGNLVCTADHYAGGRSEVMIGAWLRTVPDRGKIILETRVGRHPDAAGLGKRSMLRAVENSLTRFGTDYIDFLSFDGEDPKVPIEESLETGLRLISEGKVRFLSAARFTAPTIRRAADLAEESGGPAFRALLVEYNLMQRTAYERDFQPLATAMGRGALARLPLASGYLTGRLRVRDEFPNKVMYDEASRHAGRRGDRVLDALRTVGKELGVSQTRVALAWVLLKPGIAAAVLRAKDAAQVEEAFDATRVRLERNQMTLLDKASAL
jgi:aryl-alcohol dehydrogenase-like predicted oxidoreductase